MRKHQRRVVAFLAAMLLLVISAGSVAAQETTPSPSGAALELTTPFVGVAVRPGDSVGFDLSLRASAGERVEISVSELPEGWSAELRGRGFVVDEVLVTDEELTGLNLDVEVPVDAAEGTYTTTVTATADASRVELPLAVRVAPTVGGDVALTTQFPALRGPADSTFTFALDLENGTPEDIEIGLQAAGPAGWTIDATPSSQVRAASFTVDAGSSERITVEVDPTDSAVAGVYPVAVRAEGGGTLAAVELVVEITGAFDMVLTTADERFNLDVQTGSTSELPVLVINTGSGPLTDVRLSATVPSSWEVEFVPESLARIQPGETTEVTALVTPSNDAINGDYMMSVDANAIETADRIELRATVETSAIWGIVGVGVILAALLVLVVTFRRYGRR